MGNDNKNKVDEKYETGGLIIAVMTTLFLIALIGFTHVFTIQNKEIKATLEKTLDISHTNFMQIVIESSTNTNSQKVSIAKEEFYTSINRAFDSHYTIVRESVDSIVKNQTNMLTFWFSFLSIVMVVFTILGVFVNNRILETTEKQASVFLEQLKNKSISSIKKIDVKYNEALKNLERLERDVALSIKKTEDIEKLMSGIKNNDADKTNIANSPKNKSGKTKPSNLFSRALEENKKGNIEEAIKLYSEAIKLDNKYSFAYNNRGLLYYHQYKKSGLDEDYNNALKDYNKAIDLNGKYPEAYNSRGALYHSKYRMTKEETYYTKAKEDYTQALKIDTDYENAKNNLQILENLKAIFDKEKNKGQEGDNQEPKK